MKLEPKPNCVLGVTGNFSKVEGLCPVEPEIHTSRCPPNTWSSCKFTALNCFLTELRVILHEYKYHDENLTDTVLNVMILGNSTLFSNKNIVEYGCKKCEELEERNFAEFLQSFIRIVQMFSEKS